MNDLQEKGYLMEKICGGNFSYVLNNNSIFLPTEYKVLQSQADSCFVKCMKMLYNGNVQLYYITSAYKPLSSMLTQLDPEGFLTIVGNILSDVINVKQNGFLSCQNVELDFDKLFVEPSTYKVRLVYLPVSQKIYSDYSVFESELRSKLVKLIADFPNLQSSKVKQLSADMINGMLSLEELLTHLKRGQTGTSNGINNGADQSHGDETGNTLGKMKLIALNAPGGFELYVTKVPFTIGKKAEIVDGCIPYNKMISREHCMINRNGNVYTIMDMESANGTYVNKIRLQPDQAYPLKNGDTVRLANSDFRISIV